MDEVKHVYTVYVMDENSKAQMKQRFWVDDNNILADLEDIMDNLRISKPPLMWLAEHCEVKNMEAYIDKKKATELIMDLVAQGLSQCEIGEVIWYCNYLTGQMSRNADSAYKAEVVRHGLPFEPGEDEMNLEGKDGDGD